MGLNDDLSTEAVTAVLPGRAIRTYPALLSTEADAIAWARAGAPEGAVVVAGYQASPRGRAGQPWSITPERTLAFSLIVRPALSPQREGWVYTLAAAGLADAIGEEASIAWPDEVRIRGKRAAAVGAQVDLGPGSTRWAVLNILIEDVRPPRAPLLARVVDSIERRHAQQAAQVLEDYLARCETIGRRVRARMIPLGPGGPEAVGTAVTALKDGALVLETDDGRRVAVRPQNLGLLDDPAPSEPARVPPDL